MDIETLSRFFLWCTLINGGILLLWAALVGFAPEWFYRVQHKMFPLPRDTFDRVIYALLGLFKLLFLMFCLVPYIALSIIG